MGGVIKDKVPDWETILLHVSERDNEAKGSSEGKEGINGFGWSQCQIR